MKREEIYNKLTEVFRDVFDDIDRFLAAIEDEFSVKFDMKAVHGLKNVGEMVSLIENCQK